MAIIYVATCDFWHRGILVEAGTPIGLTAAEAKYLGHAIRLPDLKPAVAEPVESEVETREAVPAPERRKRGESA